MERKKRLAPHGASGLKYPCFRSQKAARRRLAPHGASGLKLLQELGRQPPEPSRPARGEWIEILLKGLLGSVASVSPRTGRVD